MRITCKIEQAEVEGDFGSVDGVIATCPRCGNTTESGGIELPSIKRCLLLMREGCPKNERNFYVHDDSTVDWRDREYD